MNIKKIILLLLAIVATMGAKAQVIDVYENDALIKTYYNCASKRNKVVFKKGTSSTSESPETSTDDYEQVVIYENGEIIKTYNNTSDTKYKVVFRERDYVEIGGVKWATMNVGATTVSDSKATAYGDYYAWGEIEPYYDSFDGTNISYGTTYKNNTNIKGNKTGYDLKNYCNSTDATEWTNKPYGTDGVLLPEHDVATYEWGSNWRMPTKSDFVKLRNACCGENNASQSVYAEKVTNGKITKGDIYRISANEEVDGVKYGVDGILCVDRSNINNRLFIPLTGRLYDQKVGTGFVFIWSSTYDSDQYAKIFGMSGSGSKYVVTNFVIGNAIDYRYYGQAVRPVYKYNY